MKAIITLFIFVLFTSSSFGKFDYVEFGKIPILHEGRIKPLDTFARVNLLMFYEKSSIKKISAIEWLAELLFDSDTSYRRKVFRIRNKDVTKALNIEHNPEHLFSFYEISTAMKPILSTVNEIIEKDPKLRTAAQNQLVDLYSKVMAYFELGRSLSLLNPVFEVPNEKLAKIIGLPFGKRLTYIDVMKRQKQIYQLEKSIKKKDSNKMDEGDRLFLFFVKTMDRIQSDQQADILRVVPPQFSKSEESGWHSPWDTLIQGKGSPLTVKFFKVLSDYHISFQTQNEKLWNSLHAKALNLSHEMGKDVITKKYISWEVRYNKWDLFYKSIAFYIASFLLLSLGWIYKGNLMNKLSFATLCLGSITHLFGLILRCYIMQRPPVSTLYESVVFVALVSVISAVIYEKIKKNGVGNFIGSITGIFLLFISFSYQKEGDSMGMLAAVLNTNFWLATHVVTITIGYGCCFVASVLGHVYLVQLYIQNKSGEKKFDLKGLNKSMNGATLYSLFFTVLGTILGGIWADQSWGRFWGWDPKENGAMLICLWLLFVLHGRLAGFFKPKGYAAALVLTSIVVAVAWFGVNLLNVGLHSYGFTDSIAYNLLYFSLFEIMFVFILLFLLSRQKVNKPI